jgi:hypothetical protein
VAALLAESFQVLATEHPQARARMAACLEGLAVGLRVDEEHFAASFHQARARVAPATGREPVLVTTRRRTILAVLEARLSLAEAVLADEVQVVGPLETLLRLHEGLRLYVHGAVRSPGFARLLERLRELCTVDERAAPTWRQESP